MCCWQVKINNWEWGLKWEETCYWCTLSPFSCYNSILISQPLPLVSLISSPSIDFHCIADYSHLGKLFTEGKALWTQGRCITCGVQVLGLNSAVSEGEEGNSWTLGWEEVATNGSRRLVDTAGIKSGLPNLVNIFLLAPLNYLATQRHVLMCGFWFWTFLDRFILN